MKLEEYLAALKECPDERLTAELGVFDNFPIYAKINPKLATTQFKESEIFTYIPKDYTSEETFHYVPGTMEVIIRNRTQSIYMSLISCEMDEERKKELTEEHKNYSMIFMLHPYQKKKIEGIPTKRAMAEVIDVIGQWAIQEKVPLCLPKTTGYDYLEDPTMFRRVYHNP